MIKNRYKQLGKKAFYIISLVEKAGLNKNKDDFLVIRTALLNLGNDIIRLERKESDYNGSKF